MLPARKRRLKDDRPVAAYVYALDPADDSVTARARLRVISWPALRRPHFDHVRLNSLFFTQLSLLRSSASVNRYVQEADCPDETGD
jgi:hypothetical protein